MPRSFGRGLPAWTSQVLRGQPQPLPPVISVMCLHLQYGKFHILPPSFCIIDGLCTFKKNQLDQGVELELKEAFKSLHFLFCCFE